MQDAVEHCDRQIARLREEIERRRRLGHKTDAHERRVKTLEAIRALHAADSRRSDAA